MKLLKAIVIFSVLVVSLIGFPKKMWIGGGFLSSIQFFLDFLIFFNFANPLSRLNSNLARPGAYSNTGTRPCYHSITTLVCVSFMHIVILFIAMLSTEEYH